MGILVKLNDIRVKKLALPEYVRLMEKVEQMTVSEGVEALGVDEKLFAQFKENLHTLKGLHKQEASDEETGKLAVLDQERDGLLVYLVGAVRNACSLPIDELKKCALELFKVTENYVGVEDYTNAKETLSIDELSKTLKSSDKTACLIKLGLLSVAEVLQMKNSEFHNLTNPNAAKVVEEAKAARVRMNTQFNEIVEMVTAANIAAPNASTASFVKELNELIDKMKEKH